jgi:hypothetical protein
MKTLTLFLTLLFLFIGCSDNPTEPPTLIEKFDAVGTMVYLDFSLGFYGILTNDSIKYLPLDLEEKFMINNLKIKFNFTIPKYSANTIVMWGKPIYITKIKKVECNPYPHDK